MRGPDPFEGTPYRTLRHLADRQFTELFEVEGPEGRSIAKILRAEHASDPHMVDRMRLERDILQSVSHPNIVRLFDSGANRDRRPYLIFEQLTGRSLRRELVQHGPISPARAAELFVPALRCLSDLHKLGVVHRDLHPDNLLLVFPRENRDREILKILDLGFAKVLRDVSTTIAPLVASTDDKEFVGTDRYIAPEQLVLGGRVDRRTDVHAMGLILYTALFRREPFYQVEDHKLRSAQADELLEVPSSETGTRVPDDLLRIIDRATNKNPEDRFPTADDFAAELEYWLLSHQERITEVEPNVAVVRRNWLTRLIHWVRLRARPSRR